MASALQLITRSLRLCGVAAAGETLPAEEAADGLTALNAMLDSWRIDGLLVYQIKEEAVQTLTGGQSLYTIGSGGNFAIDRPVRIERAFVRDGTSDYPIRVVSVDTWSEIGDRQTTGYVPEILYYETAYPLGKIRLFPPPGSGYELYLYTWQTLQSFANLTTDLALPPGYENAIVFNLALQIAPEFGAEPSAHVINTANEALANIKRLNAANRPIIARSDVMPEARGTIFDGY
jgi:hypothetical protein